MTDTVAGTPAPGPDPGSNPESGANPESSAGPAAGTDPGANADPAASPPAPAFPDAPSSPEVGWSSDRIPDRAIDDGSGWSSPDRPVTGPGLGLAPGSGLIFDPLVSRGSESGPGTGADARPMSLSGAELGRIDMADDSTDPTGRHPSDPDPARSTKAAAVLALGVAAVITGPLVGGVVPAALGLILARQAERDLIAGRGYLTGARQVRLGVTLAWVGIALAVAAVVAASVIGIISLANTAQDFPDTSD